MSRPELITYTAAATMMGISVEELRVRLAEREATRAWVDVNEIADEFELSRERTRVILQREKLLKKKVRFWAHAMKTTEVFRREDVERIAQQRREEYANQPWEDAA